MNIMAQAKQHCCEQMEERINYRCSQHPNPFDCPDNLISYLPKFDEYGLIVHGGGSSSIFINHCPWCGEKLPESKRDLWFERLEALGYDNPSEQDIPNEFLTDEWYKNNGAR
jgi:hypothetical protein